MKQQPLFRLSFSMLVLLMCVNSAQADLITIDSRSLFESLAPGLSVETFESGLVSPGLVTVCTGPLSTASGSTCFPSGALAPGVTYSSTPDASMVVLGANFGPVGNTSKVLGPNFFASTLDLTFPSIFAAGFDVFAGPSAGNVQISLFNPANSLLASLTVSAPLGGIFFGVVSDVDAIGRINIASLASPVPGELIDNLAFGTVPTAVAEPATMLLVGTGLVGAALRRRAQSRSRSHRRGTTTQR